MKYRGLSELLLLSRTTNSPATTAANMCYEHVTLHVPRHLLEHRGLLTTIVTNY